MRNTRSPSELGFRPRDLERLERAMQGALEGRVYRRAQAVLAVGRGFTVEEASELTSLGRTAVYFWSKRYLEAHSLAALMDSPRSGRPSSARRLTRSLLLREIGRPPYRVGFASNSWTVPLLRTRLEKRYGFIVSERTLRRRLHACGLRWKRPRYVYATKDPYRAQKKGALFAV
jgi:transposase